MNRLLVTLSIVISVSISSVVPAATILYQDSFTGTGDLDGRAPETASNLYGASDTATWSSGIAGWTLNGSEAAINTTGGQRPAFLPFTPETGYVYTLSAVLDPISSGASTGHWLALGYSDTGTNLSANGVGWVLSTISGDTYTLMGPNEAGVVLSAQNVVNPTRFSLVLDTTNALDWSFAWLMSDPDGSNSTVLRSAESFGGVPVIHSIGLISSANVNGIVDNFELTVNVEAVPEPSAFLLTMSGIVSLAIGRKRRPSIHTRGWTTDG